MMIIVVRKSLISHFDDLIMDAAEAFGKDVTREAATVAALVEARVAAARLVKR